MSTLPSIENDFPAWYAEVVRRASLAETAAVRGMMVIKPYGYAIWELLQREMDDRIKATGHENFYFPMLIPASRYKASTGLWPRPDANPSVCRNASWMVGLRDGAARIGLPFASAPL